MNREIIRVIDSSETQLDVELISLLEDQDKKYIIYSKSEKQKNGNLVLYVSKLKVKEGVYYLDNIEDDNEWLNVKKLMSNIIRK